MDEWWINFVCRRAAATSITLALPAVLFANNRLIWLRVEYLYGKA